MQDSLSFGHWVKQARIAMGLTQDVLAERVGCATQTIRKIEGGQRRPSPQMAARLAQVLDLTPADRTAFLQAARDLDRRQSSGSPSDVQPSRPVLNMPTYLTPFVGREQEQADLARLLETPACRLITLLGPGGGGKTRLAVEAAARCRVFADGVAFVPLAPISDPLHIVPAIADALGFVFSGTADLPTQLLGHLADKELLLVLDNMEHLLSRGDLTVGLVGRTLAQAPRVKLLATSRERLKMQAEWVVEVEGLPVPPADTSHEPASYPSFALFLEHAQRVRHGFTLTADDDRAIAEICRLVGGMPLGLELAAAWMRVLSPREIGQEIALGLESPLMSPQDLPERHRSLQAVFDHSWRLLSDAERRVLRRLAAFRGGCTRDAAAAIAGASLAVLATLVDKSLLRRTPAGRYDLHELIRQYALAKLREDEQEYRAVRDQHSAFFADWLKQSEHPLKGSQQAAMVTALSMEIDNIRAAWEWAVDQRRLQDIRRSSETLHWFCEFRSWFREGEGLFRHATDGLSTSFPGPGARQATADPDDEAEHGRVLGQVLADHGYLASRLGRFDEALDLIERSLDLLQQHGDATALSRALAYSGIVTYQMGEYLRSRRSLLESLDKARGAGDQGTVALCLTWLSMVEHALGAYHEAERAFREALATWRAIGNPRTTLFCITFCSIVLDALGKYGEAQALLNESLALSTATNDRWGTAMALNHLGMIAYGRREHQEAIRLLREAHTLLCATGTRWEIARVLNHLGGALSAVGAASEAEQTFREALQTAQAAQAFPDMLHAMLGLAILQAQDQHYETAFELVVYIQQHPASRTETENRAARLRAEIMPHLSPPRAAAIEERIRDRSAAEIVAGLLERG